MGNATYVYKYEYNGEIVYVGKSDSNVKQRLYAHSREERFQPFKTAKIFIAALKNPAESDCMETLLINKYKPCLNVAKKYNGCSIVFAEPKWEEYFDGMEISKKPSRSALSLKALYKAQTFQNDDDPMIASEESTKKFLIKTNEKLMAEYENYQKRIAEANKEYEATRAKLMQLQERLAEEKKKEWGIDECVAVVHKLEETLKEDKCQKKNCFYKLAKSISMLSMTRRRI